MIDIEPRQLDIIREILIKHVPDYEIRAFGSRVRGKVKPYSDLDLVIIGKEKIDMSRLNRLKEDLEESPLPIRVDIVDWNRISPEFRKVIEGSFEIINISKD